MKFRVKWSATYVTVIDAETQEEAQDEAASIDISVPGSEYLEDSWEVIQLTPVLPNHS